jgi:hypothetical protein
MAQLKNMFIKGKMNLDLDERLVPKGEYRKAQNILISNSEDSDVGAIENVRGNKIAGDITITGSKGPITIGSHVDTTNDRIFWFISTFNSNSAAGDDINEMARADMDDDDCRVIMKQGGNSPITLVKGPWLNFSQSHKITGINTIGNYLYWTDGYNQPRGINVSIASEDEDYYNCEEKISVAKVAPYLPPLLDNSNLASSNASKGDGFTLETTDPTATSASTSDYMQDKFIRFAYRYKYEDNTYSIISPFTQSVFKPLNSGLLRYSQGNNSTAHEPKVSKSSQDTAETGKLPLMQNAYDKVTMRIPIPTVATGDVITEFETNPNNVSGTAYINELKIKSIEILLKESDSAAVRLVDTIDMNAAALESPSPFGKYRITPKPNTNYYRQTISYSYTAKEPHKVLPERQIIRVSDKIPVRAKAQEIVGNRLIYGNITQGYDLPIDVEGKKGIKFIISSDTKGDQEHAVVTGHLYNNTEIYKYHNIKQRRTYQVGIVLADRFGRKSPVILSTHKLNDLSDTHKVNALAADLSTRYNSAYSWSTSAARYGQALNIDFQDPYIVEKTKTWERKTSPTTVNRPNGWFSWALVVKQTEQDYYNVYVQHPMNNWSVDGFTTTEFSGYRDQTIAGKYDNSGPNSRSFFSLTNDNINKVPRSIKESDETREGLSGSEVKLYPKVVQINTVNAFNHYDSRHSHADQDYIDVLSIGAATDQGLSSLSNAKREDTATPPVVQDSYFSDQTRVYSFLADNKKNPLVAEIPNLKLEHVNVIGEMTNAAVNSGITTGGSDNTFVIRSTNNNYAGMPFGYPHSKDFGLTVFETKPFESKIDIFYETSTCGLVKDLNTHCDYASNGPTNIKITPTYEVNTYTAGDTAGIPEAASAQSQVGELTASAWDDPSTGSVEAITGFSILAATNGANDGVDISKFEISSEDDKTYVKISAACASASAANAVDLTSSGTLVRFRHDELIALSKQTGSFQFFNTNFGSAAKFFKIWFWDNSGTNAGNKRQIVVEVNASKVAQGYTNEQASASGNIGVKWMLKTTDEFAYNHDTSDKYTLLIRATQTGNISASENIIVNITNSMPLANSPGGIAMPTSRDYIVDNIIATLTGVNGSADTSNNTFGLTATISGTNSSMFTLGHNTNDNGYWKLMANSTFNFTTLFGSSAPYNSYSLNFNVTDNGGLTPSLATTVSFTVIEAIETEGYHHTDSVTACNNAQTSALTDYWVVKNGGTTPTAGQLFEDNKVYTNSSLTSTLVAGFLVVENSVGNFKPYTVNSSGVITAVGDNCPIV